MDRFIHDQNLGRYCELLREETDPAKRETLHALLLEEEDRYGSREERLNYARSHIDELRVRIARQEALIRLLHGNGHDSGAAEQLHTVWCETLRVMERYLDNLEGVSEVLGMTRRWV